MPTVESGLSPIRTVRRFPALLAQLLRGTLDLHNVIADVFLNHQAHISTPTQPSLKGLSHHGV